MGLKLEIPKSIIFVLKMRSLTRYIITPLMLSHSAYAYFVPMQTSFRSPFHASMPHSIPPSFFYFQLQMHLLHFMTTLLLSSFRTLHTN